MDADFSYKQETEAILGSAFEVHNTLGHGFHEKPYENALVIEFGHRSIPYEQQPRFPIKYQNQKVGEFIPDLIAYGKVVIDTKAIPKITDVELGQMLNYLRATSLPVGLIINFKNPRVEYRRVILSKQK